MYIFNSDVSEPRLGSARYVFEKARFLKNAQNEPKIFVIVYLSQILLDFQNSCLFRKLILNPFDQDYGRLCAHPISEVPPPSFI